MATRRDETSMMPLDEFPEFRAHLAALRAECEPSKRFVYLLADPREVTRVRYVGCSKNVYLRFLGHIWDARNPRWSSNGPKLLFIQQVLLDGLLPACLLIEEVPRETDRADEFGYHLRREDYWAEKFRGPDLTNVLRPPQVIPPDSERRRGSPSQSGFWRHQS